MNTRAIRALPITWYVRPALSFPEHRICKAAVKVRFSREVIRVVGYACAADLRSLLDLARYELLERLFAHPLYLRNSASKGLFRLKWPRRNGEDPELVPLSEYLNQWSSETSESDGTGLAFGTSLAAASSRGLLEVCERHLAAECWYGSEMIVPLPSQPRRAMLRCYRPASIRVPFVLACIYDRHRMILACGTALRTTLAEAQGHASAEAIMIHDALARGDEPRYTQAAKSAHFASLRGSLSKLRWRHLEARSVTPQSRNWRFSSLGPSGILRRVMGPECCAYVTLLMSQSRAFVVRASVRNALSPVSLRAKSGSQPADPFA